MLIIKSVDKELWSFRSRACLQRDVEQKPTMNFDLLGTALIYSENLNINRQWTVIFQALRLFTTRRWPKIDKEMWSFRRFACLQHNVEQNPKKMWSFRRCACLQLDVEKRPRTVTCAALITIMFLHFTIVLVKILKGTLVSSPVFPSLNNCTF